jgi:endoribonuclease Dicer
LADVVESVVGAVTIACGVNFTQDFLMELGVLKYNQATLAEQMAKLQLEAAKKEVKLRKFFYDEYRHCEVEAIINYTFRNKAFLVTALMHKSYIDQSKEQATQMRLDDYERLEFLGDSILNYMVAKHFFLASQGDSVRKMPKDLHKMKTAVINNTLLSLIVIEKGLHPYIVYN